MGQASTLKVDIVSDAKGVGSGLGTAESRFSKFGRKLASVGKIAAQGLAIGLAAAVGAGVKFAQMAAEDEQAATRLATTLTSKTVGATDKQVAATERWITKQGQLLGVTDDELRPAIGRLAAATGDVGKATDLTRLSMDVAAGTGKSLEAVTTAMAKAATGNVGALGRLGIATKDAHGETLSLEQITGKLADTYKGQASKAANTTAGRFNRLKVIFSETAENIGAKLLPVANKIGDWAIKMAPRVQKLAREVGARLGPAFSAIGSFIRDKVVPAGQQLAHWYLEKIAPGIKRALIPVIDAGRDAFHKISESVGDNRPQLEKLGKVIKDVAEFIANKLMPPAGKFIGFLIRLQGGIIGGVIRVVGKMVDAFTAAKNAVESLVGWIGRIDFPSVPSWVKGAGGLVGLGGAQYARLRPAGLSGGAPDYSQRGLSTAAWGAGSSSAWRMVSRGGVTAAAGGVYVDARMIVTVEGHMDDTAAARLEQLQRRRNSRLGRP